MSDRPRPAAGSSRTRRILHLAGGPLVLLVLILLPVAGLPFEARGAMGLLAWMAWWWIARPVHLAVTGLLPLAVTALLGLAPMQQVASSYSQDTILLLLGANILTSVWRKWGLDRRVGLASLLGVGSDTTRQILVWFLVSAVLSAILPNTIVAATMIPIVVAMLRSVGIEELGESRVGTLLVIAVAWGTSAGGAATPLGGAPNLLAVGLIEESVTGEEFLFLSWITRLAPLTAVVVLLMFLFLRFAMRPDIAELPGSEEYVRGELTALGRMGPEEKWGLGLFLAAAALAFGRPLYAGLLPDLTPAFAFVAMAVAAFAIRTREGPLITWPFAQKHMHWGLFYLFAGGIALGRILSESGAAASFARRPRSLRRCGRACRDPRLYAAHDDPDAGDEQHGRRGDRRSGHDQHLRLTRPRPAPLRLHRRGGGELRIRAAVLGRRARRGRRLRRPPPDDGLEGAPRLAHGARGARDAGVCARPVVAGLGRRVGRAPATPSGSGRCRGHVTAAAGGTPGEGGSAGHGAAGGGSPARPRPPRGAT